MPLKKRNPKRNAFTFPPHLRNADAHVGTPMKKPMLDGAALFIASMVSLKRKR